MNQTKSFFSEDYIYVNLKALLWLYMANLPIAPNLKLSTFCLENITFFPAICLLIFFYHFTHIYTSLQEYRSYVLQSFPHGLDWFTVTAGWRQQELPRSINNSGCAEYRKKQSIVFFTFITVGDQTRKCTRSNIRWWLCIKSPIWRFATLREAIRDGHLNPGFLCLWFHCYNYASRACLLIPLRKRLRCLRIRSPILKEESENNGKSGGTEGTWLSIIGNAYK